MKVFAALSVSPGPGPVATVLPPATPGGARCSCSEVSLGVAWRMIEPPSPPSPPSGPPRGVKGSRRKVAAPRPPSPACRSTVAVSTSRYPAGRHRRLGAGPETRRRDGPAGRCRGKARPSSAGSASSDPHNRAPQAATPLPRGPRGTEPAEFLGDEMCRIGTFQIRRGFRPRSNLSCCPQLRPMRQVRGLRCRRWPGDRRGPPAGSRRCRPAARTRLWSRPTPTPAPAWIRVPRWRTQNRARRHRLTAVAP